MYLYILEFPFQNTLFLFIALLLFYITCSAFIYKLRCSDTKGRMLNINLKQNRQMT